MTRYQLRLTIAAVALLVIVVTLVGAFVQAVAVT